MWLQGDPYMKRRKLEFPCRRTENAAGRWPSLHQEEPSVLKPDLRTLSPDFTAFASSSWSWQRYLLKTQQFRLPCPIQEVFACHVLPPLITVLLDQAQVSTERTFSESSQVAGPRRRLLPTARSKSSKTAPTVLTFASSHVRVYWLCCFRLHFPGVRLWGSQWTRSGNK